MRISAAIDSIRPANSACMSCTCEVSRVCTVSSSARAAARSAAISSRCACSSLRNPSFWARSSAITSPTLGAPDVPAVGSCRSANPSTEPDAPYGAAPGELAVRLAAGGETSAAPVWLVHAEGASCTCQRTSASSAQNALSNASAGTAVCTWPTPSSIPSQPSGRYPSWTITGTTGLRFIMANSASMRQCALCLYFADIATTTTAQLSTAVAIASKVDPRISCTSIHTCQPAVHKAL
mmetsp:Transcript_1745/g.6087  ORF Transcript_1745/g.6087 Transcript_1745/m.6087 type:complete len:237 (-) Transcript_1745:2822-3532(-)